MPVDAKVLSSGVVEVNLDEQLLETNPNYVPELISELQNINTFAYTKLGSLLMKGLVQLSLVVM